MTRPVRVPPWPRSSVTVWASVACGSSSTARVTVVTAIRVRRRMPDLLSVGAAARDPQGRPAAGIGRTGTAGFRSEEHTSELQSLMRNSYAVFCLKQKNIHEAETSNTNEKAISVTKTDRQ